MKKHTNRLVSLLLTLCLTAGLLAGFTLPAAAATEYYSTENLQRMVVDTALAYFYKGGAVQYDSYYLTGGNRYRGGILRQINNRDPEDATLDNPIFMVCSAFPHDVYYSLFHRHIMTDSRVNSAAKLAAAGINLSDFTDEQDPRLDYYNGIFAVTAQYSYYGQQAAVAAKKIGKDINTMTQEEKDALGFPMVVRYYGPSESTEVQTTRTGVTTADEVVDLFQNVLQPGDIVVGMTKSGDPEDDGDGSGHAMMFVGDIDGDGIGELLHSSGAKYNDGHAPSGTVDLAHATPTELNQYVQDYAAKTAGLTSIPTYDDARDGYLNPNDGKYYLHGFDRVESPMSWWRYNKNGSSTGSFLGDKMNAKGGGSGAMVGPAWHSEHPVYNPGLTSVDMGGGTIRMDDWITQCGPYNTFSATGKSKIKNSACAAVSHLAFDKARNNGGFYFGADVTRTDGGVNTTPLNKFTVLRPLADPYITGNDGNPTGSGYLTKAAKGRFWLRDLSVTKSASPNVFSTVTPGGTITYTVTLTNPDAGFNGATSYIKPAVRETLPAGTTLVGTPTVSQQDTEREDALTVSDDLITWYPGRIVNGTTVTITYTVQVAADAAIGSDIVSPAGRVSIINGTYNIPSDSSYLSTSKLVHRVGCAPVQGIHAGMGVTEPGAGMDVVKAVYGKLGMTVSLPSVTAMGKMLTTSQFIPTESSSHRSKIRLRRADELTGDSLVLQNMMVPNFVGGYWLYTLDENGLRTNVNRLRMYYSRFLTPGDILVYGKTAASHNRLVKDGSKVYVYLGNDTFAYYDDAGNYTELYDPIIEVQISNGGVRYLYSRVLNQCFLQDYFMLLRPTQVADLNTVKTLTVQGEEEEQAAATVTIDGKTTEYFGETALVSALADTAKTSPVAEIKVFSDQVVPNIPVSCFNGTVDLQGHTVTVLDQCYINCSGPTGGTAEVTYMNGTLRGQQTPIYAGSRSIVHMKNMELYGSDCEPYKPNSIVFSGYAFASGGTSKVYLEDCLLASGSKGSPIYGDKELWQLTGDVTILDPSGATLPRSLSGEGLTLYTRPDKVHLSVNGDAAQDYTVYHYAASPVAEGFAALCDIPADAGTVTLLRDVTLPNKHEVSADGVCTVPYELKLNGHKLTVEEGGGLLVSGAVTGQPGVTGKVAVTGSGSVSVGQERDFVRPAGVDGTVYYDSALTFDTWSLNLDDAIRMNLISAVTDGCVMMDGEKYPGEGGFYAAESFHAKNMVDAPDATLTREQDSKTYAGLPETVSVRGYAEDLLKGVDWTTEQGENGARIGRLMLAMLRYGAEAQTRFGYRTDDPADGNVTDLLAHLDEIPAEKLIRQDKQTKDDPTGLFYGTAAVLGENMHLKFYLKSADPVTAELRYTDYKGEAHTVTPEPESAGDGYWSVTLTDLVAADIDTVVTLKVSVGGEVKATVTDSISSYLERAKVKSPADAPAARAMLVFGVAAQEYFGTGGSIPALDEDETPLS